MVMASEVDTEADVFRGCTSTELITIIVISIVFWTPLMASLGIGCQRCAYQNTLFRDTGVVNRLSRAVVRVAKVTREFTHHDSA